MPPLKPDLPTAEPNGEKQDGVESGTSTSAAVQNALEKVKEAMSILAPRAILYFLINKYADQGEEIILKHFKDTPPDEVSAFIQNIFAALNLTLEPIGKDWRDL